jgi:ABC-2 type transport system ATP-binding protein
MLTEGVRTESLTKFFEKTAERGRVLSLRHRKPKERIVAVDRLNLSIPSGMVFGLLGPNGAGKTTTVKLLSTLLLPDRGTAFVNGFDVSRQPNSVRSIIGVVTGGDRGLYSRLTGRENLLFFARLYGVREDRAKTRIEDLMKLVELTDRADDVVEKYSRGMKQRLHLIRGLIHDPPILLLDEPTLGLDPNSAVIIREFIKEKLQKEQGKTILLTTHYMEEADQLCDSIAVIDHGSIIAQGSPSDLKSKVREYDVLRIDATNPSGILLTELKNIEGVLEVKITVTDPVTALTEIVIHSEKATETLPQLTETMVKLGVRVRAIEQLTPSLEDAFIDLTGRRLRD